MTRLLHRPHPDEASIPVATRRPAESPTTALRARRGATHLTGIKRIDRRPLDFSDLRDDAEYMPEWARPLTIDEQIADIHATVKRAPFARHEDGFRAKLALVATDLAKPLPPATDWLTACRDELAILDLQFEDVRTTATRGFDAAANRLAFDMHQAAVQFAAPVDLAGPLAGEVSL